MLRKLIVFGSSLVTRPSSLVDASSILTLSTFNHDSHKMHHELLRIGSGLSMTEERIKTPLSTPKLSDVGGW